MENKSGNFRIYFIANIWSYQVIFHKIIELEGTLIFHSVYTHASRKKTENQKKGENNYSNLNQKVVPQQLILLRNIPDTGKNHITLNAHHVHSQSVQMCRVCLFWQPEQVELPLCHSIKHIKNQSIY